MASGAELFLGLDVGTQSTKALVYDAATGDVVERSQVTYDLIEGLPAGHAEQQRDAQHNIKGSQRSAKALANRRRNGVQRHRRIGDATAAIAALL